MNQLETIRYEWKDIPWTQAQRTVYKLQKRIYRAEQCGNVKQVHRLQRLLLTSRHAKLISIRRVTQDNKGRNTAGVDGIAKLKPEERLELVDKLTTSSQPKPTRRVWIPKPGKEEKRPLGIPTMEDRAKQALVKLALEPQWEAQFEPNSYGFRPGRSCHDAIEAIFGSIKRKNAFVLDADIAGCFDNIDHKALLSKLNTFPKVRRVIKGWLKAGVLDKGVFQTTKAGTPQGGVISPLLANIALHGLETHLTKELEADLRQWYPKAKGRYDGWKAIRNTFSVIRYADDFVIIHENEEILTKAKIVAANWLKDIGLELKPSKTRICHTLNEHAGESPGFEFLGFHIRQYKSNANKVGYKTLIKPSKRSVKNHLHAVKTEVRRLRGAPQTALISKLNPIIKGWSRYFLTGVSRKTFERTSDLVHQMLWRWARFRHAHKGEQWVKRKYFRTHGTDNWRFMTDCGIFLIRHSDHKIQRHIKVSGTRSPYDGDYVYWSTRMGKHPLIQPRMAELLKLQKGKCYYCNHYFQPGDIMETHHLDGNHSNNNKQNIALLHGYCHDKTHSGMYDKHQMTEEPDDSKGTCPVLKPSRDGDIPA